MKRDRNMTHLGKNAVVFTLIGVILACALISALMDELLSYSPYDRAVWTVEYGGKTYENVRFHEPPCDDYVIFVTDDGRLHVANEGFSWYHSEKDGDIQSGGTTCP